MPKYVENRDIVVSTCHQICMLNAYQFRFYSTLDSGWNQKNYALYLLGRFLCIASIMILVYFSRARRSSLFSRIMWIDRILSSDSTSEFSCNYSIIMEILHSFQNFCRRSRTSYDRHTIANILVTLIMHFDGMEQCYRHFPHLFCLVHFAVNVLIRRKMIWNAEMLAMWSRLKWWD